MNDDSHEDEAPKAEATLRRIHAARAESAAARAAALSHYVEKHGADDANAVWKAAHAGRVAAQALAVLAESGPDPAANARCARNAAAAAAQAALMGRSVDAGAEASAQAAQVALKASQAAAAAAGAERLGADATLNAAADEAERAAVTAAENAGWIIPGEKVPGMATGVRSPEMMSMLHL
ncbi:hypothetical protein [Streptomyces sp. NPDC016845]|uniref:hypothetical protein n=1 Tax=Streptomyces sp. NPDC016845 TaxID=3364972 RepID=UPI0037B2F195